MHVFSISRECTCSIFLIEHVLLIYPPSSVPRTQNGRQKAALPHPQRLPPCHDGWAAMTSRSFALDQGAVAATASVQVENFFLLELRR